MGAGGSQDVGLDGGGDQVALPLENRGDHEAVGLERPWRAEGQHRVALFDGQVEAAQQAVFDAVAAAEDDPSPPGPKHEEPAQLPELAHLAPRCLRRRRALGKQSQEQPVEEGAGSRR